MSGPVLLPSSSLSQRLERVRESMRTAGLGAFISFGEADCRYLTGFTGEAASVVVTEDELILVTDSRFTIQAKEEAPSARLLLANEHRDDQLAQLLRESLAEGRVAGIDGENLTVRRWDRLRASLAEEPRIPFAVTSEIVSGCRAVKFPDELTDLRAAGELVTQAFAHLEEMQVVGRTEGEIALELEFYLRQHGSEGIPFPFIVAAGPRSAMPHAEPTSAVIQPGQLMVVDIGAMVGGYASDMTRTYATGTLPAELHEAYNVVQAAQARARERARPGMPCRDLDSLARTAISDAGLGDCFVHSLGHGVGLEVHEGPRLSANSDDILAEAMVVTIEPGVYLAGRGGIRIEDTVVVTTTGAEVLTDWPRDLKLLA